MNNEQKAMENEDFWELGPDGAPRPRQPLPGERDVNTDEAAPEPTEEEMEDILATQLTRTQEDLRTANDEIARLRASLRELTRPDTSPTIPQTPQTAPSRTTPQPDFTPLPRRHRTPPATGGGPTTRMGSGSPIRNNGSPGASQGELPDLSRTEPQAPGSPEPGPRENIEVKREEEGMQNTPLTDPGRFSTNELLLALVNELRSPAKGPEGSSTPPPPRNSAPGFRPPKIEKLKSLGRGEMSEFLLRIEKLRNRAQLSNIDISVTEWMSNDILERLQAQGVDIHDDQAIIDYLKNYKGILDESHNSQALSKLRLKLSWPKDALTGREAPERYVQEARDLVGIIQISSAAIQKQMLKILVQKLPTYFQMSWTDYKEENPDVKTLEQFHKSMSKYEAIENLQVRQRRKKTTGRTAAATYQTNQGRPPTTPQGYNRTSFRDNKTTNNPCRLCSSTQHRTFRCPRIQCRRCNGFGHIARYCDKKDEGQKDKEYNKRDTRGSAEQKEITPLQNRQPTPNFNRHNASRVTDAQEAPPGNNEAKLMSPGSAEASKKDIPRVSRAKFQFRGYHLQVYNPIKNLWEQVPGCLDSGATFTIGSLELHGHLCSGVVKIKPMEFFLADTDTVTEADHQGIIEIRVHVDDGPPVYFGDVTIYLVSTQWKDLLIGRLELDAFQSLPEQVLQKLPNEVRTKLKKRGEEGDRPDTPRIRRVQIRDMTKEPKYSINSVSMKTIAQRSFAPKETRAEFEKQAQEHEEKCRKLGLPRAQPILFSNPDDGDDMEHFEAAVGGDTILEDAVEDERLEEGETFENEKSKVQD
eukprot:snap_masked-scaffold_8-processed-gene-6.46-mRNA-1 protein AED:1.00 eAED:1.00 QI:0/-1/0/0/-1/1/1/0/809